MKLPMKLEMDHKGPVDPANNWSVGGRTWHLDVGNFFLRELKDQGLLIIGFVPGDLRFERCGYFYQEYHENNLREAHSKVRWDC